LKHDSKRLAYWLGKKEYPDESECRKFRRLSYFLGRSPWNATSRWDLCWTDLLNEVPHPHDEMIHDLTLAPQNMKKKIFVMPARMAGIQIRKDAFGDIHV